MAGRPYTYLIGWSSHNVYYYGVRFSQNCHPNDLWKTYFTSSKYVQEFRLKHGEPDVISIRREFLTAKLAQLWEAKVLKRLNVRNSEKWLNKTDTSLYYTTNGMLGKSHSLQTINKMQKPKSDITKQKMSLAKKHSYYGNNNPFYNKTHSEEFKHKQSNRMKTRQAGKHNTNSKTWIIQFPNGKVEYIQCLKEFCLNINESVYKIRNNKSKNYTLIGIG